MLEPGIMEWLRRDPQLLYVNTPITGTLIQVATRDPMRFAAVIGGDPTQAVFWTFGEGGQLFPPIFIPANGPSLVVTSDQIGGLITQAIFSQPGTSGSSARAILCSYNPQKWRIYEQLVRQYLSNAGAL